MVTFLPPLLTESLLPANTSDVVALRAGQARVTMALAAFGTGGILGDLGLGIIMTFGPFARRHFLIFVLNDLVMIAVSGEMDGWMDGVVGCTR